MIHRTFATTAAGLLAAALVLAACAGSTNALLPSPLAQNAAAAKAGAPKPCAGQNTTSLFATSGTSTIASKPRSLCVPAFDGYGGSIEYPAAKPSVTAVVTSSTTNYNGMLPVLAKSGKPMFYLQIQTSAGTVFGKAPRTGGALIATKFIAGHSYTVYGQAVYGGVVRLNDTLTPCTAKAVPGKYGGVINGIGTMLANQNIDNGSGTIYFEVYAGKHVKQPCTS